MTAVVTESFQRELMSRVANRDWAEAARLLRWQVAKNPEDVQLRREIAEVLVLSGDSEKASQELEELSETLVRQGQFSKAVSALKRVQSLDPLNRSIEGKLAHIVELEWKDKADADQEEPVSGRTYIVGTPLFGAFSSEELLALVNGMRLVRFEPGDIIVSEGEPGKSLYVLNYGIVKAFVRDAAGRNGKVRELHEGDVFGEIAILSMKPRTATITAATPCELLELDRSTLDTITGIHPAVRTTLRDFSQSRENSSLEEAVRSRPPS